MAGIGRRMAGAAEKAHGVKRKENGNVVGLGLAVPQSRQRPPCYGGSIPLGLFSQAGRHVVHFLRGRAFRQHGLCGRDLGVTSSGEVGGVIGHQLMGRDAETFDFLAFVIAAHVAADGKTDGEQPAGDGDRGFGGGHDGGGGIADGVGAGRFCEYRLMTFLRF